MSKLRLFLGLIILIFAAGCQRVDQQDNEYETGGATDTGKLKVVATTTIVGDVVSEIGGDLIDLTVLLPVGTDPHGFDPTPQDVAKLADADVIFANGLGLEEFLDSMIESAGVENKVVYVSDGIDLLRSEEHHDEDEGEEHHHEHNHGGIDPHTWFSPLNVMVWIHNIAYALSDVDPDSAQAYAHNEEVYEAELVELDTWIREQVAQIPEDNRNLVTDHSLFTYFADEYSFTQVGALIPGYSTVSEPTAQELAQIEDAIEDLNVKAVFVGYTVNPVLGERVADDTGTELVFVYTGALSETDGAAATYLHYMRYNTTAFVNALR
ncbi:MAG: metal ABC transporter substrate-binding protein [Anaerolineales bacterium]|nr:metal ABC transporter substrate-binding protein [Anaerolineales bacterium]